MFYRLFPFTLSLFGAIAVFSQSPQNISLEKGQLTGALKMACDDTDAGTISFANFVGQSNDTDPDTIFLCQGDKIDVIHNGDQDLSGDPNPATAPGINYVWYDCPPTEEGPNLDGVLMDGCIFVGPPPPDNGFYVTGNVTIEGNTTFENTFLPAPPQVTFNNGDPFILWFAPITVDDFADDEWEVDPLTGETGPCVNVNAEEAFAVAYLNEITIENFNPNAGTSGCAGRINVSGGLPELDGSFYEITIELMGNPSVQGTVTNGTATHGDAVLFDVPVPGLYQITVEDGKSCGAAFTADMTACINMTQSIESAIVSPGDNFCLEVTVEGGFEAIQSMQYSITYDPSVLQYTGVQNLTPLLPSFNQSAISFNNDTVRVVWFQSLGGTDLPDGTLFFEICFDVIGADGQCTDVSFSEIGPITDIEIVDENGNELGFNGIDGLVCISNAALQANVVQDSTSCANTSDGGFTIDVSGGTPPYNITWQSTMGGPIFGPATINVDGGSYTEDGLPIGDYIITITDDSPIPITSIGQVEVLGPPMMNLLFSASPGQCNGDLGGVTATLILDSVIVTNLTDYSFLWSTGSTDPFIQGVASGNYSLTVTDNITDCTVEGMVFLPQTAVLAVDVQIDSATCTGLADGVISVSVSGGTPDANGDYNIMLGPTIVIGTTANLMIESGTYNLVVTDDNGCSHEEDVFLPSIKILSIAPNISQASCNGDCNGSIAVIGQTQGGTPSFPYSFTWTGMPNPPAPINLPPDESQLFGLCIGTYNVLMLDAQGCRVDSTFEIIQPSPLNLTLVDVTNESCQPGSDGSITIAVAGGTYPYTYEWTGFVSTDSIATDLPEGAYTVIVTDAMGCFGSIMADVTQPDPPVIAQLDDDTVNCADATNGSLTVVPADPSNIAEVLWSNGELTETINGLMPGEYIVTITDFSACTATDTAYVTAPDPLVIDSFTFELPTCVGFGNGQISVIPSGGTPPYNYSWSEPGAINAAVVGNLTSGNYMVTITDDNNCPQVIGDIFLPDPPAIVTLFPLNLIDSVSCANTGMSCDGTATVIASYSDGSTGTFNFLWISSGETTMNSDMSTAVQLCQGDQLVIVSDQSCVDTAQVNIPAPPSITPDQDIENVSCNGFSDGEITLMPSGGTPPYTIVWGNGTLGPVLPDLPAGNYTAVITDTKNCSFTHTVTVIEPPVLALNLDNTITQNVICAGEDNGRMAVVAQGGNTPLGGETYIWQNNVGSLDSRVATDLAAGTYTVTVVDVKGCEAELTHTILEPEPIGFRLADVPEIDCFGGTTSISVDSAWGGTGLLLFSVDGGPPQPVGQSIGGFIANEHTITVIDVNDCETDTTINIIQPVEIIVDLPDVVEIDLGDSLTSLNPIIVSSVPIDSFIWSPPNQLSCADCKNPRVNPIKDQLYTLIVIDINGCTGSGQVLVDLDRNRNVFHT